MVCADGYHPEDLDTNFLGILIALSPDYEAKVRNRIHSSEEKARRAELRRAEAARFRRLKEEIVSVTSITECFKNERPNQSTNDNWDPIASNVSGACRFDHLAQNPLEQVLGHWVDQIGSRYDVELEEGATSCTVTTVRPSGQQIRTCSLIWLDKRLRSIRWQWNFTADLRVGNCITWTHVNHRANFQWRRSARSVDVSKRPIRPALAVSSPIPQVRSVPNRRSSSQPSGGRTAEKNPSEVATVKLPWAKTPDAQPAMAPRSNSIDTFTRCLATERSLTKGSGRRGSQNVDACAVPRSSSSPAQHASSSQPVGHRVADNGPPNETTVNCGTSQFQAWATPPAMPSAMTHSWSYKSSLARDCTVVPGTLTVESEKATTSFVREDTRPQPSISYDAVLLVRCIECSTTHRMPIDSPLQKTKFRCRHVGMACAVSRRSSSSARRAKSQPPEEQVTEDCVVDVTAIKRPNAQMETWTDTSATLSAPAQASNSSSSCADGLLAETDFSMGDRPDGCKDEDTLYMITCCLCAATHCADTDLNECGLNICCADFGEVCCNDLAGEIKQKNWTMVSQCASAIHTEIERETLGSLSCHEKTFILNGYSKAWFNTRTPPMKIMEGVQQFEDTPHVLERYRDGEIVTCTGQKFVVTDESLPAGPGCKIGGVIGSSTSLGRKGLGMRKMTKVQAERVRISNKERAHIKKVGGATDGAKVSYVFDVARPVTGRRAKSLPPLRL